MPNTGIPHTTEAIRIARPIIFKTKVMVVFPSPFKTLLNVVERYKNGHIQPRVTIKVPANSLANNTRPIHFPRSRKAKVQVKPSTRQ